MEPQFAREIINRWTEEGSSQSEKVIRLFEKVRDIPYGDCGSRDPKDVHEKNKGTCSGKHELLKALYKELHIEVKDFIVMHRFKDLKVDFPDNIKEILDKHDIVDPHNFFKILRNDSWITIDITWDKPMKRLGFPVNENWDGVSNMDVTVIPSGDEFEVLDAIASKKQKIAELPEEIQNARKKFLKVFNEWLDSLRQNKQI